jgi:transcriptional regulator GlxA family with amidase domain
MTAYEEMITRFKEMTLVDTATDVIHWDMETYMPPRGIGLRSEQLGALSRIAHRMAADPENGRLLDEAEKDKGTLDDLDAIIVCGGRRIENNCSKTLTVWLRSVDKQGLSLGAICTGSHILAEAGLLDGYSCSIHWENLAALKDRFRNVSVSKKIFTIDRNRFTSSGGTTPVDMMLHIIKSQCGSEVSAGVAEQFIFERIRQSDDDQHVPLRHSEGRQSEKLLIAAALMEANIREPISQEDLATYVGLSRRQLQRLFSRYLSCTPSNYYSKIRLQRARQLLRQTSNSIVEISVSTGFISSSHFSKAYREMYGHSPSSERLNA